MANCKKVLPPPAPQPPPTYVLELTEEEAGKVCAILGSVNAMGYSTKSIWEALCNALNGDCFHYPNTPSRFLKYVAHDVGGENQIAISLRGAAALATMASITQHAQHLWQGVAAAGMTGKISTGKAYSAGQTPNQMQEQADKRGLDIRYPKENELFVDIDNARDYARFKVQLEMLKRIDSVLSVVETPSASGGQHRHIVVTLARYLTQFERIGIQAMLGSDLKREMLSYERLKTGSNPHPTVFFEPKPGVVPKSKVTGFNCKCCNERNDFAEANQDDGTYVCFNCRVDE